MICESNGNDSQQKIGNAMTLPRPRGWFLEMQAEYMVCQIKSVQALFSLEGMSRGFIEEQRSP